MDGGVAVRRFVTVALVVVLLLVGAGLGVGGWYYTDELLPAPVGGEPEFDTAVVAVDEDAATVTLEATEGDLLDLATLGFWTADTTLELTDVVAVEEDAVTRTATVLDGGWPAAGDLGAATTVVYRGDPQRALGLGFDEIVVEGPIGPLPAWRIPADPAGATDGEVVEDAWAVLVHGRGATREAMYRSLRTVHEAGLSALVVSVRNDAGAAQDPDGWGRYGEVEWEDLQAAVDHLVAEEGAQQLVPVGSSQGGSLVLSWLRRGTEVERATGVVLTSPLVSMRGTLDLQARNRGIPGAVLPPLLWSTRLLADLRAGMDFDKLEHAELADAYDVPMLVTHGTADSTVPADDSVSLAEARPDLVTLEVYDDVEHVREWNADRERTESDLRSFLEEVTG